jgi:cytochrome c oxidase subunit 3
MKKFLYKLEKFYAEASRLQIFFIVFGFAILVCLIVNLSGYKYVKYNLTLPETQSHNYHLFDEQQRHYKQMKSGPNLANGFGVLIPILLAFSLMFTCLFFVNFLWGDLVYHEVMGIAGPCVIRDHLMGYRNFFFYLIAVVWLIFLWFEHVAFESLQGYHTSKVNTDYKMAFILFLVSEIMFFFSIFWAFFHFSLIGSLDIGYTWPPVGIDPIPFLNLPLLNTALLVTSGLFVTWSHNGLKSGCWCAAFKGLIWTIVFGSLFLFFQGVEYISSNFSINDSVFGSIFFFGTGFHGLHVMLGTVALIYNFFKLIRCELSPMSHYSYLFTIWYWHFVDVIWLFLYLIFYVWGQ